MASRREILSTKVTTRAISRVSAASSFALQRFGMHVGGPNVGVARQRSGFYDVFNNTRSVAIGRAPGVQSASVRRQVVGQVAYTVARIAEKLPLNIDELNNQRVIGGADDNIDEGGVDYIARQQRFMGQRAANFRLVSIGGLLRGAMYLHESGDDLYFDYTSSNALFTMDFQIPAGNKSQLDMLGAGNIIDKGWQDQTANIPDHLMQINAAFQQLTGSRLELVKINSTMWNHIVNNDYAVSQAGIANTPFTILRREDTVADNGRPQVTFEARLACAPWITFIISDEGLDLGARGSETYTKYIPDNYAWFGPDPLGQNGRDLMEMLEYAEPISDGPNQPAVPRRGLYAYNVQTYDPAAIQMHTIDNAIPALYVPASTAFAQVANF